MQGQREPTDIESRSKRTHHDMMERTSDHYYNNKTNNGKKPMVKKRKICDIDETRRVIYSDALNGSSTSDVSVKMSDNGAVIEIKCPCRSGRILEIMEAVNNLNIDFNSVQSTEADGSLHLIIKSKVRSWLYNMLNHCINIVALCVNLCILLFTVYRIN